MLDEARAAYRSAGTNPVMANCAPIELEKAEDALRQSQHLLQESAPAEIVEHYAYLARQHAATAEEKGKQVAAEQAIDAAGSERDKTLIMSRTTEADVARKLQAQVAELQAKQSERGLALTLGDAPFDTGKAKN